MLMAITMVIPLYRNRLRDEPLNFTGGGGGVPFFTFCKHFFFFDLDLKTIFFSVNDLCKQFFSLNVLCECSTNQKRRNFLLTKGNKSLKNTNKTV